jgi:DNA-binding transcriptional LysR family regulator
MTLQQLHYVIVIAEIGSMNKASEILYISQPSLTSAVHELEKELGITIFHRSKKGVVLTADGLEFIPYARELYAQYESVMDRYGKNPAVKKKFAVSSQHYSFAVKSFVELVRRYNPTEYEFAIRETKTREVIEDVASLRSEIGIIYLSEMNRAAITKLLRSGGLAFHKLTECSAYVYLWKGHPLAGCSAIRFDQLRDYPCLSFEQGDNGSFYYAEEILSTNEYPCTIKANDRATMLNLMVGLNGYTLCSGIISEEINGTDYVAVPFEADDDHVNSRMEIGYIVKKNMLLSKLGSQYIAELQRYLAQYRRR